MSAPRLNQPSPPSLTSKLKTAVLVIGSIVVWFAMAPVACSQPQPKTSQENLTTVDEGHGLHTIDNQRLRGLMEELKKIRFADVADDLAAGRTQDERIEQISEVALHLAGDARMIPQVYKNLELSDESRRVFDDLAAQMQEQCHQLRDLARRHQTTAMQAKVEDIMKTCNACHASFRGPSMAFAPQAKAPF